MPKEIPKFNSEDEEREFWATHDSTEYVDWSKASVVNGKQAFPKLKLTEDLLELKLPIEEIRNLESLAKNQHLSRTALAEQLLREAIKKEQNRPRV